MLRLIKFVESGAGKFGGHLVHLVLEVILDYFPKNYMDYLAFVARCLV